MNHQTNEARDRFQAEFEALPLEQKIASLWKMEAATLEEAVTYAVNSSVKAIDKLGEVFSDIGTRVESEVKKAAAGVADCKPRDADYTPPPPTPPVTPAAAPPAGDTDKPGGNMPNP